MFLDDLLQRTLDGISPITPRRVSRYEASVEPIEAAAETDTAVIPTRATTADEPARLHPTPRQVPPTWPNQLEAPRVKAATESQPERVVVERHIEPVSPAPPPRKAVPAVPVPAVERTAERRSTESPPAGRSVVRGEEAAGRTIPKESRTIENRTETRTIVERFHELERITRHESVTQESRVEAKAREARPVVDGQANRAIRASQTRVVPETRVAKPAQPVAVPMRIESTAPAPVVHVTIGRVEVRAATNARPAVRQGREPKAGLEEYLQRRERA